MARVHEICRHNRDPYRYTTGAGYSDILHRGPPPLTGDPEEVQYNQARGRKYDKGAEAIYLAAPTERGRIKKNAGLRPRGSLVVFLRRRPFRAYVPSKTLR